MHRKNDPNYFAALIEAMQILAAQRAEQDGGNKEQHFINIKIDSLSGEGIETIEEVRRIMKDILKQ